MSRLFTFLKELRERASLHITLNTVLTSADLEQPKNILLFYFIRFLVEPNTGPLLLSFTTEDSNK